MSDAVCSVHEDRTATVTCSRCGAFACSECVRIIDERMFCAPCGERPDVDYVRAFRDRVWGKRDVYVWWFGLVGIPANLAVFGLGAYAVVHQNNEGFAFVATGLLGLAVYVSYLLLQTWARGALFGLIAVDIVLTFAMAPDGASTTISRNVLPFIFFLSAYRSTRNKLAFRIDVDESELRKFYKAYYDNQLARAGFVLAVLSVVVPFLALIALPLSIVGYRRADPDAHPPVGRKKTAIAGIVLGALGLVTTAVASYFLFVA